VIRRASLIAATLLFAPPAFAGEPLPPQLSVSFIAEPAPIVQDGSTRLFYEMIVANFYKSKYVLDAVEARAGATEKTFDRAALENMIVRVGDATQPGPADRVVIDAGRTAIVFLMLDLGPGKAPETIEHTLHVLGADNAAHVVELAPLAVAAESPIVVAPPLRGDWIAGDSVNNRPDAAHRRAVFIDGGRPWLSQRYAIDWVQYQTVDGVRTTWRGPEDRNDSYFCYGQPIYSVADGTVIEAQDGLPENVPHSGKYAVAIDANSAAGNHVVEEIAPHRYVLYAHMRPGTVQVKAGQLVRAGEILGHVGNTGSSTEPHLHMHIDDQPSFLAGNGVPYEFTSGSESGPVEGDAASPQAISFGPIGPQRPFVNDYPAENALVTFK
jgi:hypothetical protein